MCQSRIVPWLLLAIVMQVTVMMTIGCGQMGDLYLPPPPEQKKSK